MLRKLQFRSFSTKKTLSGGGARPGAPRSSSSPSSYSFALPKYSRLKTLSKLLNIPAKKIAEQIGIHQKSQGRYVCCYGGEWYAFLSASEIIIPYKIAEKYSQHHKKKITFVDYDQIPSVMTEGEKTDSCFDKIPVIALLGHFNHGKTTLLDAFAGSDLVSKEAHGITQEVRTKFVSLKDSNGANFGVTLVDTPGQEIFYRMRNYGAGVADMALLLVAANDGIGNQTQESIGALEDLKMPAIVCLNKIDHPTVLPMQSERIAEITSALREFLVLEKAPIVPISALIGTNLNLLQSEISRMVSALPVTNSNHVSLKRTTNNLPLSVLKNSVPRYTGLGTVLNIWTSPNEGQMIHLVVRDGEIQPGMWFSAGGWAGNVVVVYSDDEKEGKSATKGMGVKIRISAKMSADPRPIGDHVYFFHDREDALLLADYRHMEVSLEDHLIPRELWGAYGISTNPNQKKKSKKDSVNFSDDFDELVSDEIEQLPSPVEDEMTEEEEDLEQDISVVIEEADTVGGEARNETNEGQKVYWKGMEFVEEEDEYAGKDLVILKAKSDLALCTFMDSVDEIKERLAEYTATSESMKQEGAGILQQASRDRAQLEILDRSNPLGVKLREVIRGGIGNVNLGDITMAKTANAPVLAYEVGVNSDALKLAQTKGVKILYFNKMQDVVDILRGSDYSKYRRNISPPKVFSSDEGSR